MLLPLVQALHITGMLVWVIVVVVLFPAPILFLEGRFEERLGFPDWLVTLAAYQAVAICGIAILLVVVLMGLSAIRWLGFL